MRELSHLLAWMRANPEQANVGVPATGWNTFFVPTRMPKDKVDPWMPAALANEPSRPAGDARGLGKLERDDAADPVGCAVSVGYSTKDMPQR